MRQALECASGQSGLLQTRVVERHGDRYQPPTGARFFRAVSCRSFLTAHFSGAFQTTGTDVNLALERCTEEPCGLYPLKTLITSLCVAPSNSRK